MKIQFLGAAQTVTGSCHMLEVNGKRFAVDCGMHQGASALDVRNQNLDAYKPKDIDFFLITHAHIDHTGLLPMMVKHGFKGKIYCTRPTSDLLELMLRDSAHIQEMEASFKNMKNSRKGSKLVALAQQGAWLQVQSMGTDRNSAIGFVHQSQVKRIEIE